MEDRPGMGEPPSPAASVAQLVARCGDRDASQTIVARRILSRAELSDCDCRGRIKVRSGRIKTPTSLQ